MNHIPIEALRVFLRKLEGLDNIELTQESEFQQDFANHLFKIKGVVSVHGKPYFYSTDDIDIRGLQTWDDVYSLVKALYDSFDKLTAKA
jgi:hypothetical protein